jgi:hypothetical protein
MVRKASLASGRGVNRAMTAIDGDMDGLPSVVSDCEF